jgi:hypothetical protein
MRLLNSGQLINDDLIVKIEDEIPSQQRPARVFMQRSGCAYSLDPGEKISLLQALAHVSFRRCEWATGQIHGESIHVVRTKIVDIVKRGQNPFHQIHLLGDAEADIASAELQAHVASGAI